LIMIGSRLMRGLGIVSILVGLLVWSGAVQAKKPNSPGNQGDGFVVLGNGDVLDTTTSLRWQQDPGGLADTGSLCEAEDGGEHCSWQEAVNYCAAIGGGYRLPEIHELISLVDYSESAPGAALGDDGPFTDVHSTAYWAATTNAGDPAEAWGVFFSDGHVESLNKVAAPFHAWCVR
jgi:hypothetical protein